MLVILEYTPLDLILVVLLSIVRCATFGTFSVGIFTATVLKSTGIATFQNRIEGPGNFRVKESTGYVGINTVLPQNSLDVRGGVHIGGGDQIIIDGQDIYRQNATLNLRNQQGTGGSEVQIRYQHGLSLKGGTDGTGGIELDAGRGLVKSPNGDFVIGSASTTGTVDQKLQVTGGAYVSGVWASVVYLLKENWMLWVTSKSLRTQRLVVLLLQPVSLEMVLD